MHKTLLWSVEAAGGIRRNVLYDVTTPDCTGSRIDQANQAPVQVDRFDFLKFR
jgi:hypothetical protein